MRFHVVRDLKKDPRPFRLRDGASAVGGRQIAQEFRVVLVHRLSPAKAAPTKFRTYPKDGPPLDPKVPPAIAGTPNMTLSNAQVHRFQPDVQYGGDSFGSGVWTGAFRSRTQASLPAQTISRLANDLVQGRSKKGLHGTGDLRVR